MLETCRSGAVASMLAETVRPSGPGAATEAPTCTPTLSRAQTTTRNSKLGRCGLTSANASCFLPGISAELRMLRSVLRARRLLLLAKATARAAARASQLGPYCPTMHSNRDGYSSLSNLIAARVLRISSPSIWMQRKGKASSSTHIGESATHYHMSCMPAQQWLLGVAGSQRPCLRHQHNTTTRRWTEFSHFRLHQDTLQITKSRFEETLLLTICGDLA